MVTTAWPRFRAGDPASPVRPEPVAGPWPRWGWFPREQRSWTLAPGPALVAREEPRPQAAHPEPVATTAAPRFIQGIVSVRRSYSTALVPVRSRELALTEVARVARRVAPAAAVAGVAAVAAMAFFRRR